MLGRPVSMHAMRGIAAHANGFHTCRTIHVLQMLLGAIDTPGSFRYQPPYPKPAPPGNKPAKSRKPDGTLTGNPLGYPQAPDDLLVDEQGAPRRLDHAFSWEFPLAAHGLLQGSGWRVRPSCDVEPGTWAWEHVMRSFNALTYDSQASAVDLHWRLDPTLDALPTFAEAWQHRARPIGSVTLAAATAAAAT